MIKPTVTHYRVRLEQGRWYVRTYADRTIGDCVDKLGPFSKIGEAITAGDSTGLINGDE